MLKNTSQQSREIALYVSKTKEHNHTAQVLDFKMSINWLLFDSFVSQKSNFFHLFPKYLLSTIVLIVLPVHLE